MVWNIQKICVLQIHGATALGYFDSVSGVRPSHLWCTDWCFRVLNWHDSNWNARVCGYQSNQTSQFLRIVRGCNKTVLRTVLATCAGTGQYSILGSLKVQYLNTWIPLDRPQLHVTKTNNIHPHRVRAEQTDWELSSWTLQPAPASGWHCSRCFRRQTIVADQPDTAITYQHAHARSKTPSRYLFFWFHLFTFIQNKTEDRWANQSIRRTTSSQSPKGVPRGEGKMVHLLNFLKLISYQTLKLKLKFHSRPSVSLWANHREETFTLCLSTYVLSTHVLIPPNNYSALSDNTNNAKSL